ncbi:MAG: NYN domain-containing protein [bacterium]
MRTHVYVDGFNLYYGCLNGSRFETSYRWLNPVALAATRFSQCSTSRLYYFSARVSRTAADPHKPQRQQAYLDALQSLENPDLRVTLKLGTFLTVKRRGTVVSPIRPNCPSAVEVSLYEEKGSDVNLAAYLLKDAFQQRMEAAIVISNDSDLVTPIQMCRDQFGIRVFVLNPHSKQSRSLRLAASRIENIREADLQASQLPDPILTGEGRRIRKPAAW